MVTLTRPLWRKSKKKVTKTKISELAKNKPFHEFFLQRFLLHQTYVILYDLAALSWNYMLVVYRSWKSHQFWKCFELNVLPKKGFRFCWFGLFSKVSLKMLRILNKHWKVLNKFWISKQRETTYGNFLFSCKLLH